MISNFTHSSDFLFFNAEKKRRTLLGFIIAFIVLNSSFLTAQTQTVIFNTAGNGSWTVPPGVTSVTVEAWGGGGGGGGSNSNDNRGSGGGSGGYALRNYVVTPGTDIVYTIGDAGSGGGSGNNAVGGTGGDTTILGLTANGGTGGQRNNGIPGDGGTATGGTTNTTGNPGVQGNTSGNGGNAPGGGGTGGLGSTNAVGGAGNAPGGGGGGGERGGGLLGITNRNGGAGGTGGIKLTYTGYCTPVASSNQTYINNFSTSGGTTDINNAGSGVSALPPYGYQNFYNTHEMTIGLGNNFTATFTTVGGRNGAGITVWVDWNKNNLFEAGELVYSSTRNLNGTVTDTTTPITVPTGLSSGEYVLRIIFDYSIKNGDACTLSGTRGEAEDYKIIIPPPCAGTPTGGTAAITPATGAVNSTFNVSVSGASTNSGLSYQWQIAESSTGPWSDIPGATSSGTTTLTAVPFGSTTRYYRRKITCMNGGAVAYSTTVSFTTNAVSYCNGTTQSPNALYINRVAIVGTMADPPVNTPAGTGAGTNGYSNFTTLPQIAQQAQGEGINVKAQVGGNTSGRGRWKAWVDWNGNGTFENSELIYTTGGTVSATADFGFAIPATQSPGNYRMRIRVNNGIDFLGETFGYDFGPCDNFTNGTFSSNYGETEDYLIKVVANCEAKIATVTHGSDCGAPGGKAITLAATANIPVLGFRWYSAPTGGTLLATTNPDGTGMATAFTTDLLAATTVFYVEAFNDNCSSTFRVPVTAEIKPTPEINFTPSTLEVCGESSIVAVSATGGNEIKHLITKQTFEDGTLGVFTNQNIANITPTAQNNRVVWQNRSSVFIPQFSGGYLSWYPAISSGFGGNKFVMSTSDVNPGNQVIDKALLSPSNLDSRGLLNLTLKFKMFYSHYSDGNWLDDDYVSIEVSTNNGTAWTQIDKINADVGQGTAFEEKTYNLNAYVGVENLRLRIRYYANGWFDGVAIDDIELYGERPLQPSFVFTSSNPIGVYTDPAGTIDYTGEPISTVYFKPTEDQMATHASWNVTATASLNNSCNAIGTINLVNNTKIWNPATATNWFTNNWLPSGNGASTADKCVVIKKPVVINTNANALARSIRIETTDGATGKLTVNGSLTVTDAIVNTGAASAFIVKSDANLKQINENPNLNTGDISVRRLFTWSGSTDATRREYNFLSSPVYNQNMKEIYGGVASHVPYVTKLNESTNLFVNAAAADYTKQAKGFAVREPKTSYTGVPSQGIAANEAEYKGVPNNGTININLDWTSAGRGYNLVGNPYPSNIDIVKLYANSVSNFTTPEIDANFRFWDNTVNATYVQMGGAYQGYSYAIFNAISQTSTAAPGLDPNPGGTTGASSKAPGRIVKVNQAFMIRALQGGASMKFNNTMRETTQTGSVFYGKESQHDRYRLQLSTAAHFVVQNAVTYFPQGNNAFGPEDARIPNSAASDALFTYAGDAKVVINGRSMFDSSDVIPLGTRHFTAGTYRIQAVDLEGVFANGQSIYLKDKALNIFTDLTQGDYTFTSESGEFTNRFEIVYKPGVVLATETKDLAKVEVYRNAADFVIRSSDKSISHVELYDASGRLVSTMKGSGKELRFSADVLADGMYVLKATLKDGEEVTRKIRK